MVNWGIPAGVASPRIDIGNSLRMIEEMKLRGVQANAAQFALDQQMGGASALANAVQSGYTPQSMSALAQYPNALQTATDLRSDARKQRDAEIGKVARGLLPYVDSEEFPDMWDDAVQGLYDDGYLNEDEYEVNIGNASPEALNSIISQTEGLDEYYKLEGMRRQEELFDAMSGGAPTGTSVVPDPDATSEQEFDEFGNPLIKKASFEGVGVPARKPRSRHANYFDLLRNKESGNLGLSAKNPKSSASGPWQFTDGTWNGLMNKYPELNLTQEGRATSDDENWRAVQALTMDNANYLADNGFAANDKNLRLAHFFGPTGAKNFMQGMNNNPDALGTDLVSNAVAKANYNIFYGKDGKPKKASSVLKHLTKGMSDRSYTALETMVPALGLKKGLRRGADEVAGMLAGSPRTPEDRSAMMPDTSDFMLAAFTGVPPTVRRGTPSANRLAQATRPVQNNQVPADEPRMPLDLSSDKMIPLLSGAAADPMMPKATRDWAMKMLEHALKAKDPVADIKKYEYDMADREARGLSRVPPSEWWREQKRAGATTIDMREQNAWTKGLANIYLKRVEQSDAASAASFETLQDLSALEYGLSDLEGADTGTLGPALLRGQRLATALGVGEVLGIDPTTLGQKELVQSIGRTLALKLRSPESGAGMPGSMSDGDRAFLESIPPGLEKTSEGNALILKFMKARAERNIEYNRKMNDYLIEHGKLDPKFFRDMQDWARDNPLFGEEDRQAVTDALLEPEAIDEEEGDTTETFGSPDTY